MGVVETVRGAIPFDRLGRVLVHEHILTIDIEHMLNYCADFVEEDGIANAVEKLNKLKVSGIDTIIDLTVLGLGRYIPRIVKIAAQTELNIIVSTGCYTLNELPLPFRSHRPDPRTNVPDPMTGLFVDDILVGIADTGVKANELKCAIDVMGLTPGVERTLRAVGQANLQTGAPITVHTAPACETGLVAQRVLAEEGVDLRDVIIGHCGDTTDLDYLMKIADRGSMLGMDRFGLGGLGVAVSLEQRVDTIVALIGRGYLDSITVSHDCFCWTNALPGRRLPDHGEAYLQVSNKVVPALLVAGVAQDQIDRILIDNPRRHFEEAAQRFNFAETAFAGDPECRNP